MLRKITFQVIVLYVIETADSRPSSRRGRKVCTGEELQPR